MADVFTIDGYNGSSWGISFGGSDYLGFSGASFGDGISPGSFNESTHKTDATMSADGCSTNHVRNCRYASTTTVSLMEAAAVTVNTTNVLSTDCTIRWHYEDDTPANTELSNVNLFAYNGSDPVTAPSGCTILAFERETSAIYKDRESDTPGDGGAWDSSKGIGGSANALICSDRTSAASHDYYFAISATPTSKGLKTGKIRWEFDAA